MLLQNVNGYLISVGGVEQAVFGSILVWGRCTEQGRTSVMAEYGLADVLSLESIISDLVNWQNQDYFELVRKRKQWCEEFFADLELVSY